MSGSPVLRLPPARTAPWPSGTDVWLPSNLLSDYSPFPTWLLRNGGAILAGANKQESNPGVSRHALSPGTHPRATEAAEPGCRAVIAIVGLHVVIATVGFLLDFKGLEYQLHAIAVLCHDHPVTAGLARVVVVPKLGMGIELFGLYFGLQLAPTLWSRENHREAMCQPSPTSQPGTSLLTPSIQAIFLHRVLCVPCREARPVSSSHLTEK